MGCVQQAVLEFDGEVQAPWRPRLVSEPSIGGAAGQPATVRPLPPHPSRRNASRVGACRAPVTGAYPTAPGRRRPAPGGRLPAPGASTARPGRDSRAIIGRRGPERLRLTRRARRLAVVLALAAGVALGSWLAPLLGGGGGDDLRLAGVSSVTVESGDTLWSIASSVSGNSDVRAVVDQIRRLNALRSVDLVPGQVLQLP
ncbi:MAG: Peptidoglycan-binding lysin domain protein [Blastococcus sp.]|nr:Peptidoglycan-binding lysin domain protein [Blastococcus sp.]